MKSSIGVPAALAVVAAVSAVPAVAQTKPATAKTWTCAAPGLLNSSYDGGPRAYIHLVGFPAGGHYEVTANKAGTVASGITKSGVKFTCTAS